MDTEYPLSPLSSKITSYNIATCSTRTLTSNAVDKLPQVAISFYTFTIPINQTHLNLPPRQS
jgi:hypothetical protein